MEQICAKFIKKQNLVQNLVRNHVQNLVRKFSKCSLAVKSTIFAGCLTFDILMDVRYSASYQINIFDRKIEFITFSPIMKYQR